mgnify:CR=1 FL=1
MNKNAAVNVPVHSITIKAASLLYAITKEEHIDVNSFHHQGIKKAWEPSGSCG